MEKEPIQQTSDSLQDDISFTLRGSRTPTAGFSAGDGLIAIFCGIIAISLFLFPLLFAPNLEQLFKEFGNMEMTTLVKLVLSKWFVPLFGAGQLLIVFFVISRRKLLGPMFRRALLYLALVLGLVAYLFVLMTIYTPLLSGLEHIGQ